MKRDDEKLDDILDRYLPSAVESEMESDGERVWSRLRPHAEQGTSRRIVSSIVVPQLGRRRISAVLAAAAVLVLVFIGTRIFQHQADALAIVESADGLVYRGTSGVVYVGAEIGSNETLRSEGAAMLALTDGTRVEVRAKSELLLERADDGVRIRLGRGGVLVNAARQPSGRHLYVQTKDVTVSVVGTVFLVNAEEEGSRVAVIEGEVRVKQGETEKSLHPGEQVVTNRSIPSPSVKEEISWSRNAEAHIALLLQATPPPPRDAFEVASIRPTALSHGTGERGAGGNGGRRSIRPFNEPCSDAGPFFLKFDPSRVDITDMTVYGLITWAYGIECRPFYGSDFLIGGPSWIKDDGYDIHANIPAGPPPYTEGRSLSIGAGRTVKEQFMTIRFRNMLQTLLAERFHLALRKEMREMPAYVLSVAKNGPKLTPWKEGESLCLCPGDCSGCGAKGYGPESIRGQKQSMADLAFMVKRVTGTPVLDQTNIAGEFNFSVSYDWIELPGGQPRPAPGAPREPGSPPPSDQSIFNAFEQTLGLKLEAKKMPMEVMIIERLERPSEN